MSTPEDFVDDSGDLTPYDFRSLDRKTRYNALPDDIKECLALLKQDVHRAQPDVEYIDLDDADAAVIQILEHFGAL